MTKDLGLQYRPGMFFTDDVKKELIRIYWEELVHEHLYEIDNSEYSLYNKLLPYIQENTLDKVLSQCLRKEEYFNCKDKKFEMKHTLPYFIAIAKNIMMDELSGFINYIKYINDPIDYINRFRRPPHEISINYFNNLCKRFNREQLLNDLLK
jgi:hypothetical protein